MAHDTPPHGGPSRIPDPRDGTGADGGADASAGPHRLGPRPKTTAASPRQPRASAPPPGHGRAPFAWQHGSLLLLLEARPLGWIMAELRFDPTHCHYVEIRRTRYRWAREAAGALLSRALAAGASGAERAAQDLDAWLIRQ